jgi:diguanylate cyclase (GGDEF)-like protein/PAS domain S-box-containing protein
MPLSDPQAFVDGAAARRRNTTRWLFGVNATVALLLSALVWLVLDRSYREFQNDAQNAADGLAAAAQLSIQSEIDRIDGVLQATVSELDRLLASPKPPPDATLDDILHARFALLNDIEAFRLADAHGRVRWGNDLPSGAPPDVSDRDYFRTLKQQSKPTTLIGGPLKSRVSGHWVITFMHRVQVDGRFAGLVYVSIDTEHFRRMFQQYRLEPRDAITLRRSDHQLIARYSPGSTFQGEPGDASVSAQYITALASSAQGGQFVSRTAVDGEERTTAFRTLKGTPFVVLAGVSNERIFKPWRDQLWIATLLAGLAWLLVVAGSWGSRRAQSRVESVMQQLADQGKRIQVLLRTAGDGIHIVDGTGHLVELSDSFADMLHSSRDKLLGRHISSWDVNQDQAAIDAWLAKVKPGDRQRVDVQHRRDDGRILDVELQLSVTNIAGQLLVFSSARDVTQQRQLMREQAAMLDTDLIGMAKIEDRTITWRNRALERILGYGQGELQGQSVRNVYWDDAGYRRVGVEGYHALQETGYYRSQLRMRSKSGDLVWIDFGAVPFSETEVFVMLVDITATKRAQEGLLHAASHDALTQLPNRVLLHDRLSQALGVARRQQKQTAVCYLDLDGFKPVNDEHGHAAGDHLLKTVAHRLVAAIRPSDTAARLGGDEFALVLTCIDKDEWEPVLDRVIASIEEPMTLESGARVTVSATIGVAIAPYDECGGAQELIARADHVMLRGKRAGKGRVFT